MLCEKNSADEECCQDGRAFMDLFFLRKGSQGTTLRVLSALHEGWTKRRHLHGEA